MVKGLTQSSDSLVGQMSADLEEAELLWELKASERSPAVVAPGKDIGELFGSLVGCPEGVAPLDVPKVDLDSSKFETVFRSLLTLLGLRNQRITVLCKTHHDILQVHISKYGQHPQ